ncbi:hypothetical protein N657DRAFT_423384 [Parathielavia appendiculata]|uniref:Uncharacterized protein n=1 Tax=Parathielavia appendiculata TaxID=2587402 RepID=A0AAN6TZQ4_9PEZI|nr:hypothetical protein N657DRAFT_423384 [Parathielavia appendiculata]
MTKRTNTGPAISTASFDTPSLGPRRLISTASGRDWLPLQRRSGPGSSTEGKQPAVNLFLLSRDTLLGIRRCFQMSQKAPRRAVACRSPQRIQPRQSRAYRQAAVLVPRYHPTINLAFTGHDSLASSLCAAIACRQVAGCRTFIVVAVAEASHWLPSTLLIQQTHVMAHGEGQLGPRSSVIVCVPVVCVRATLLDMLRVLRTPDPIVPYV